MTEAPPFPADPRPWRAWHIFLHTPQALDRMLIEGVLPECRALEASGSGIDTFFIRYWENGPHIRFRLCGIGEEAFLEIGERLRALAGALAAEGGEAPTSFGPGMRFDGTAPEAAALEWRPQGSVIEIPYEPEYRRYGGFDAIVVNERLFGASSMLALAIVERTLREPGKRQGIALALTAAALATIGSDPPGLQVLLQSMREGWSALVSDQAAANALAARGQATARAELEAMIRYILATDGAAPIHPLAARWREIVEQHLADLRVLAERGTLINPVTGQPAVGVEETSFALQNMVFSQIHMMNNRLGVLPVQEYHFAQMLLLTLESSQ